MNGEQLQKIFIGLLQAAKLDIYVPYVPSAFLATMLLIAALRLLKGKFRFVPKDLDLGFYKIVPAEVSDELSAQDRRTLLVEIERKCITESITSALKMQQHIRPELLITRKFSPIGVADPFRTESLTDSSILSIFRRENDSARLVVLGAPGSGKSLQLRELLRELIGAAKQEQENYIPLYLELSSWKASRRSFNGWLVDSAKEVYGLKKEPCRRLIAKQKFVLLLDALDEIKLGDRESCVVSLNRFVSEHPQIPIILSSQFEPYKAGQEKVDCHYEIVVQPLNLRQIERFIESAKDPLAFESLKSQFETSDLLSNPLMLSIICSMPKLSVVNAAVTQAQVIKDYVVALMRSVIGGNVSDHQLAAMERRIGELSNMCRLSSSGAISIEYLQPNILRHFGQLCTYHIFVILIVFLVICIIRNCASAILGLAPFPGHAPTSFDFWASLFWPLIISLPFSIFLAVVTWLIVGRKKIEPVEAVIINWGGIYQFVRSSFVLPKPFHLPLFTLAGVLAIFVSISSFLSPSSFSIVGLTPDSEPGIRIVSGLALTFAVTTLLWLIFLVIINPIRFFFFIPKFMKSRAVTSHSYANQTLLNSLRSGIIIGFAADCFAALLPFLVYWLPRASTAEFQPSILAPDLLRYVLNNALFYSLPIFFAGGAMYVVQNLALRSTLAVNGYAPWRFIAFLDRLAEKSLMDKTGTTYQFRHSSFRQYFLDKLLESGVNLEKSQVVPERFSDRFKSRPEPELSESLRAAIGSDLNSLRQLFLLTIYFFEVFFAVWIPSLIVLIAFAVSFSTTSKLYVPLFFLFLALGLCVSLLVAARFIIVKLLDHTSRPLKKGGMLGRYGTLRGRRELWLMLSVSIVTIPVTTLVCLVFGFIGYIVHPEAAILFVISGIPLGVFVSVCFLTAINERFLKHIRKYFRFIQKGHSQQKTIIRKLTSSESTLQTKTMLMLRSLLTFLSISSFILPVYVFAIFSHSIRLTCTVVVLNTFLLVPAFKIANEITYD